MPVWPTVPDQHVRVAEASHCRRNELNRVRRQQHCCSVSRSSTLLRNLVQERLWFLARNDGCGVSQGSHHAPIRGASVPCFLFPLLVIGKPIAMDTDALKVIISRIGYPISVMDYWGGRLQQSS